MKYFLKEREEKTNKILEEINKYLEKKKKEKGLKLVNLTIEGLKTEKDAKKKKNHGKYYKIGHIFSNKENLNRSKNQLK